YDIPKRSIPGMATHCERWDGPALDGTPEDRYDGTDADLGVIELEREVTDLETSEEFPRLPSSPSDDSPYGEYAFVGYGFGEAAWANGGFRFLGDRSIKRVARIHVQREQLFDSKGRNALGKTWLFPAIYLKLRGQ